MNRGAVFVIAPARHGDTPMAVSALKKSAADFIEKPFGDKEIVASIGQRLERDRKSHASRQQITDVPPPGELTGRDYLFGTIILILENSQNG